jgi:hypothetical protein
VLVWHEPDIVEAAECPPLVIPAKAGLQKRRRLRIACRVSWPGDMDSRLRGNDVVGVVRALWIGEEMNLLAKTEAELSLASDPRLGHRRGI